MIDRFLKNYGVSSFPLGAEVVSGAIIGGSSLLSGILGSSSAESARDDNIAENEKNRKFNAEQAELQRNWASDEWNRQFNRQTEQWYKQADYSQEQAYNYWLQQQEYNTPVNQVSRLMDAGLNPAHVVGNTTFGSTGLSPAPTSVPSPSVPSGSSASISTSNPVSATSGADAFSRIASGASDIVKAITSGDKDSATAQRTKKLMGVELELLLTDKTNKELMNDYQQVYNAFFRQKMPTELKKLSGEMELTYLKAACARSEDDLLQLKSITEQMQQDLLGLTGKIKNEELTQAIFVSNNLQKNLDAKLALMRSQESANSANAFKARAEGATENQLRDVRESLLKAQEAYTDLLSKGVALDNLFKDKSFQARVKSVIEQAKQAGLVTNKEAVELAQQLYQYDIRKINQFFDWLGKGVGAYRDAGIGTSAFRGYKGNSKDFDGKGLFESPNAGVVFDSPWSTGN